MKKLFSSLSLIAISAVAIAQDGNVIGRVIDSEGYPMPGATIVIDSTDNYGISDVNGNYRIIGVDEGIFRATVNYVGYKTFNSSVNIESDKTVQLNITLQEETTELGDIVVTSTISGQSKALSIQKNNSNITNVVSSDQMGQFPDNNIGEAVRRIPGVTIQNDQGEARDIIIRGMAPQLNSVTINGDRIPSAEGGNRRVQMDLIPADMIQTVEVSKTITPDMDADAIGGSVNLITRAAAEGQRISIKGSTGINTFNNQPIWNGSAIYGNRFLDKKLGVVVSGSYNNVDYGSDNVEYEWENDGGDNENQAYIGEQQLRQYYVQRIRRSISSTIDYKLNNNNTFFLKGIYNRRDDYENRYRLVYKKMDYSETELTEAKVERQTKGGSADNKNRRLEDQRMWNVQLGGEHLFGKLATDWRISTSKASENRPNERYIEYAGDDIPTNVDYSDQGFENSTAVNIQDTYSSNMEINELSESNKTTYEKDINASLNFELSLNDGKFSNKLKFGGRYRGKEKMRENTLYEYESVNGLYDNMTSPAVVLKDQTRSGFMPGNQFEAGEFFDAELLGALDLNNPSLFDKEQKVDDEFGGENYNATENVIAGYVMLTQNFGKKFQVIAGVRVENTDVNYKGFSYNDDEETLSPTEGSKSYTDVLPSVHLKYDLTKNTILRAAWTNTLARPNYYDQVPYQILVPGDNEAAFGNSNLEAATSMNFDLMAEHYNGLIGLISGGVFYKQIDNFIYTSGFDTTLTIDGVASDFESTKPKNGATADVLGFEINIQRSLDFIPGKLWKYVSVYGNYTYTNTSAKGIEGRDDNLSLEGTAGNMINGSLAFDNKKFQFRASLNFTSDYVDEYGKESFFDRYYDKQMFLDVNASYNINKMVRVFASATNLTNQPLRYYQGASARTIQMEYYGSRFNVGVNLNL